MRKLCFILLFSLVCSACGKADQNASPSPFGTVVENGPGYEIKMVHSWDQWGDKFPSWVAPVEPFNVIGNVYYVGTEGLSSFLITSEAGHILIDGTLPQNVPQIVDSIKTLGFKIEDVKILLNSHAHFDHSGGLNELKALSGAKLVASEGDRSALEGGFYLGAEFTDDYFAPRVSVDEIISDMETIELGENQLTANITPGHSRGCTSWTLPLTLEGEVYDVLFFCSATVAGNRLVPAQYAGIVEDYKTTFDKTRNWKPDVFLSNHPSFFEMKTKRAKQKDGDLLAFVDRDGFPAMMQRLETDFKSKLQKAKSKQEVLLKRLGTFAFNPTEIDNTANYILYSHGRIVENQGIPAHSPQFGPYEYVETLETFRDEGFTVFSNPRVAGEDVKQSASDIQSHVLALLDAGVPAKNISLVGASKGAYIVSLVSHTLKNPDLNVVLLAGCSQGTVLHMIEADIHLYGKVLTVRDLDDMELSGSCAPVLKMSSGAQDYQEIVVQEGLSHGLIYTPHAAWVGPTVEWVRGN